ncbi:hypothetical protein X753_01710 [Mesorhizobium sp. LNJC399B00]|nr:hypothetical protein X753_01710 [Mesorhizobium sp. LNJC399B00]
MVGDADENDDQRFGRQGVEQGLGGLWRALAADRQYTAMHVEAGDPVHDGACRNVDRQVGRGLAQDVVEPGQPVFEDQDRLRSKASG